MNIVSKSRVANSEVRTKDRELLIVIHKACVFSFVVAMSYAIYTVFVQGDWMNFMTTLPFILIFSLEIIFYKFKNTEAVKVLLVLGIPLLVSAETLCMGGDFSQSAILLACLAVGFVFFTDNKRRFFSIGIVNIAVYVAVLLYIRFYGPLYRLKDDPYDEIISFIVSASYLYFIFTMHDRDNAQLIQNLEKKNQKLLVTTQELERFTNIASHDLKSPLRNIASFLGLIEREFKRGDTSNLLSNLDYARNGAIQMHYLIEGILEISKVNQDLNPHKEVVDLNILLMNAINNLHQDICEKKAIITSAALPKYFTNPIEITLLFQNLIQNAIKYNQSVQPRIEIKITEEANLLKLSITDNGIGIEPKYHEYIFEHFKRLHNSSEYMGTGLGLSLCRKIVQKYGGKIMVDSDLGKGSTFTILLPKTEAMA